MPLQALLRVVESNLTPFGCPKTPLLKDAVDAVPAGQDEALWVGG